MKLGTTENRRTTISQLRKAVSEGSRFSIALPLLATLCLWVASSARADEVLDQEYNTTGPTSFAIAYNWSVAQTFTAGMSGTLSHVDVTVTKGLYATADLILSLWSTSANGSPLSQLAASSLPATAISSGVSVVSFGGFSQSVNVTPGTVLGIRLSSPALNNPPYNTRYDWAYDKQGNYPGGRSFVYGNTTLDQAAADFDFRTYVTPVPEPTATVLAGCGLFALGLLRRRK